MKKIIFTAVLAATVSFATAQETNEVLTNSRGTAILPTAGSWGFGIDATPFLRYAGGLIGGNAAVTPTFGQDFGFHGRYFLTDNTALRFGVNLGFTSDRDVTFVPEAGRPADSDAEVRNVVRTNSSTIILTAGLERRIGGQTRLQGFYGAQAEFGFLTDNNIRWTYGNDLPSGLGSSRPLRNNNGLTFAIGAGVFAGVEYFIAPRISLGGQVGWGIGWAMQGRGSTETEIRNISGEVEIVTVDGNNRSTEFYVGHAPHSGITLTFHF
ncbi:MAG: hypothetical protein FWD02_04125 [Bacteroidales bacterium]|nr:hypothetical protein [Bacteroidales bacterium]